MATAIYLEHYLDSEYTCFGSLVSDTVFFFFFLEKKKTSGTHEEGSWWFRLSQSAQTS